MPSSSTEIADALHRDDAIDNNNRQLVEARKVGCGSMYITRIQNESYFIISRPAHFIFSHKILYISHFISEFSTQTWQFAVVLFLAAMQDYGSLFLVSGYGVCVGLAVVLVGPWAARCVVDEVVATGWNRLSILQLLLGAQKSATLIECALCFGLLLHLSNTSNDTTPLVLQDHVVLLSTWMLAGSCAVVLRSTLTVALERDWMIVVANATQAENNNNNNNNQFIMVLTNMNVTLRQIHLMCKIVAPAVTGFLVGRFPMTAAVVVLGSLTVMSLFAESLCAYAIYHRVPGLKDRGSGSCIMTGDDGVADAIALKPVVMNSRRWWFIPRGLYVYMQQRPVCYAGLAFALL